MNDEMESKKNAKANANAMKISMEELALQRIFDLKKEFSVELESHHTKLKEGLLWNLFIKGIDPPPWLRPILPPLSNYGSGYRDSFNSSIRDDRFSGFGGFRRKRPRFYSNVPDCFLEETELEGFENGHTVGTGSKQVLDDAQNEGNGGKQSLVDAQVGRCAEKQHSPDVQVDENGIKEHLADAQVEENGIKENLVDAQVDQNGIKEHLVDAQIGRNLENHDLPALAQMDMDICGENKGAEDVVNGSGKGKTRSRAQARGLAKERNKTGNVVKSPFVGRMTRSRAKQCQIPLSGNELGKRKAIASKQTSNKRIRHVIGVEEPNNVTLRSSKKAGSRISNRFCFATSTLEPQGIIPSAMTQSHCENHKTEGNSSAVRILMQGANNSEPSVTAMLEAEDNAIIDNVDFEKEMLKISGVKSRDLEQVEKSAPLPVRRSIEFHDLDVTQQPEISEATDTAQHQDISNAPLETIKENQPLEFRSELTSRVIEECVETVQQSEALEAVVNPKQDGISEIINRQVDSDLASSFHDLQKHDSNIILDPTKKFRSKSLCLECCKNIPWKVNNSDSKLLAFMKQADDVVIGGGDCTNQIHFSRSQRLSKKSEIVTSQGERDQNHFSSEEGSPAASICCSLCSEKKSGKQSGRTGFETNPFKIFDVPASAAKGLKPQHTSWPGDRKQNALAQEPRLLQAHDVVVGGGDYTNQIHFCRSQRLSKKSEILTAQGERDQNYFSSEEGSSAASICCSLSFEKKSGKQSGRTRFETNPFKIFDAPASAAKELKPQHTSWPGDRKQNALAQEPRLLQSKSCSGVFEYSNPALDSNANDAGLISQFEWAVTPYTSNSKIDKENEGQRNVGMMKKISSEVEVDIVPQKSEVIEFVAEVMDEPSEHLLRSVNMRGRVPAFDFCKDGSYGEQKDSGHESHGVLTSQIGMSISEVDPKKKIDCLEADCQVEVTIANSELAEGVRGIPGMQHLIQSGYMLSPTKRTVDASGNLKELEGLHHGFSFNDKHFSPVKMNAKAEKGLEYEAIRDGRASFVNGTKALTSLTPAPIHVSKSRLRTPSDVHWRVLAMEHPEYSEKSSEFLEKIYGPNGSSADKIWANSGSKDVAYGSKIKYSCSLTSTSRMLFDRTATNSVDTSSNLFMIQDEMNREHAGCFPIEEESGFEEESMNLHATVNESAKSPLMKKSVKGAKSVLLDCSSAKQNSPLMTPAGERLFQRSSTYSTDIGSNLFSKQVSKSQKNLISFNLEEEVVYGKENKVPCEQGTELQKKYGSSVKKKVMKNHNLPNDGSFASQISPRSHQKPSNILSNVKSFIPLVQQKKAAASVVTGKRDIKVKALEVAEAAKRQEEKKEQERKMRKELARRGGHETNLHEKSKEGDETSRGTSECSNVSISSGLARKRLVGCASQKSHVENSSQPDTAACGVVLKVKRVLEAKTKLEQERLRKLEEGQRRKEEERKKKEADIAAKKRKREEIERKEREEKRKRYEVAQRQQKELEEQLRTEKEVKEQRRRALDDYERKRKAMEEGTKKQRRLEKEKEAAERRRQLEEDAKASKFTYKDAKHVDETNLQAQKAYAGMVSSMSNNCGNTGQLDIEGQSRHVEINAESYEISPYKGSDEDDDDSAPKKFIPLWARKENVIPHIISQQHIDPDEIFTGAKTCSLYEVFGTDGSLRRKDFSRRSHSGEWLNDKFTWKEEYQYKLQMGYLN